MMQKRNNNGGGKMRHGGHNNGGSQGGGGRRFQHRGGRNNNSGSNNANDAGNIMRQKHHATQMREKYSNMAKDAQMNGDVVEMEYYLQHVDHYVRVLMEVAAVEAERFAERAQHQQTQQTQTAPEGDAQSHEQTNAQGEQTSQDAPIGEDSSQSHEGERGYNEENVQHRAPRQTRRPYRAPRSYNASEGESSGGSTNPNANHSETPLPASVIPQI